MRDPVRIQRILNKLAAAWQHSPDLRLGQLVQGVRDINDPFSDHCIPELFYIEDDTFEEHLDSWLEFYGITVSGGWKS